MKKKFMLAVVVLILFTSVSPKAVIAQSWNITGNSNATGSSKLGTTNLVPLKFFTNNNQRMIVDSLGRVGIGITKPVNIFTVKSGGGTPGASWLNGLSTPVFVGFGETASSEFLLAGASNTAANRAVFQGRRSRGTLASPAAVVNDDYITSLLASAYDGSTFQNPALVSFFVDGTPSSGNVPARISFVTGSNATNRVERLKVGSTGNFDFNNGQVYIQQSNGSLAIGTSSPQNKFHVDGTGSLARFGTGTTASAYNYWYTGNDVGSYIEQRGNTTTSGSDKLRIQSSKSGNAVDYSQFIINPNNGFAFLSKGTGNGNVGIGTTDPGDRLSIKGGAISFHHTSNDVPYVGIDYDPSSDAMRFRANLYSTQLNTTYFTMQRSTGNIGIGTTDPGNFKLKISHGAYGLDIEDASSQYDWEIATLGIVTGGEQYQGELELFFNNNFRGSFDATSGLYQSNSDERLKTNIKPMSTMLQKINQLKPSTYQFKDAKNQQEYNGFIAQDVMKLFPALVTHHVVPERKLDVYTMDYSGFGILAIKGIQELTPIIEEQKEKIATLEDRINKLEAALETLVANKNEKTSAIITSASLEQNVPNPFNNTTSIGYTIPQKFTTAQIKISDKNGKILKAINISGSGKGTLNVDAAILSSGAYNYSLFVNGKLVGTKQMERLK